MKSNAPGQLLGYSIQFPRALSRLLELKPGGSVSIEVKGDVSSYFPEGIEISEEDKSSINGNPLTNRSDDLWKTFYNWIQAIEAGDFDVTKTNFVLYSNQQGRKGIVNSFSDAHNFQSATDAISDACKELSDVGSDHEIWIHLNYVLHTKRDILIEIIQRFELVIGPDDAYSDVDDNLKALLIPDHYINFLTNGIGGWLQRRVNCLIANKEPATITFEDFQKEFTAVFTQIRHRDLIDFASTEISSDLIATDVTRRPIYIQQLDYISLPEDDIVEAVADYLSADYNRMKWIEAEIIDESAAMDFEKKLTSFWKNAYRETEIIHAGFTECQRGQLLLGKCQARQEQIGNQSPPARTIPGTYHAMANTNIIGWHPKWESLKSI